LSKGGDAFPLHGESGTLLGKVSNSGHTQIHVSGGMIYYRMVSLLMEFLTQ